MFNYALADCAVKERIVEGSFDVGMFGFLLLLGGIALLWSRVSELERRLRNMSYDLDALAHRPPARPHAADEGHPADEAPSSEQAVAAPPAVAKDDPPPEDRPVDPWPLKPQALPAEPVLADPPPVEAVPAAAAEDIADYRYEPAAPRFRFDFEDLFGRLLPIWAGGVTLAVAGFFIVRYTIEAGLLTPEIRVLLGLMFGFALIAGAELAYRFEARVADERVRQALSGAGLATLYASIYLAGTHYGLIGTTIAFLGLAGVTAGAIGLSFRFGMPSAVLGLVGGFAAPALVGGEQANIPLLTLYLALVTGGLMLTARRRRWAWLGIAALGGGLGWGALLLMSGIAGTTDLVAMGGYLLVLGVLLPAFALSSDTKPHPLVDAAAAVLAAGQMAVLVDQGGYSFLAWGLYGLLAGALALLGWKNLQLRRAAAISAALALSMLLLWPDPAARDFALVTVPLTAILAAVPLAHVLRRGQAALDTAQLCGFALGLIGVSSHHFGRIDIDIQPGMAAVSAGLALLPAIAAWKLWPKADEDASPELLATLSSAALAVTIAGFFATPLWAAGMVVAGVGLGLVALVFRRKNSALVTLPWIAALAALGAMMASPMIGNELARWVVDTEEVLYMSAAEATWQSMLRWAAPLALFAGLAAADHRRIGRRTAEALAVVGFYGLLSQIVPVEPRAWIMAGTAIALAWGLRERVAAHATAFVLAFAFALPWVAGWLFLAVRSLGGEPMTVVHGPAATDVLLYLVPSLAAGCLLAWRRGPREDGALRRRWWALAALAGIALHILFKQVLLLDADNFVLKGMLERTLWEALLLVAAYTAFQLRERFAAAAPAAGVLAGTALLHFAYYSALLHNALWSTQTVGPWPVANLLLPAYGTAIAAALLARKALFPESRRARATCDIALMGLIGLLALSLLRQAFAGPVLVGQDLLQSEDMLRSLTGIVLAIGFLLWGTRTGQRSWRVGSLVLMLGAVFKVFLFDAAGLEGLARIASFVALGFSLIGIGWFYSRQLRGPRPEQG